MVLVDTPVWSLALRRKPADLNPREQRLILALAELAREGRAQVTGVIRQELLSRIRDAGQFENIARVFACVRRAELETSDYEAAARMHNQCRARGVAGSSIDFLICA